MHFSFLVIDRLFESIAVIVSIAPLSKVPRAPDVRFRQHLQYVKGSLCAWLGANFRNKMCVYSRTVQTDPYLIVPAPCVIPGVVCSCWLKPSRRTQLSEGSFGEKNVSIKQSFYTKYRICLAQTLSEDIHQLDFSCMPPCQRVWAFQMWCSWGERTKYHCYKEHRRLPVPPWSKTSATAPKKK